MAGGRNITARSPGWLHALIWSTGLGAAAVFVWRALFCDGEPTCLPVGLGTLAARALAVITLPLLLLSAALDRILGPTPE
jgi:hypothetical protein